MSLRQHHLLPVLLGAVPCLALAAGACSVNRSQGFDSISHLRSRFAERIGPTEAAEVEVPYQLGGEILAAVEERLSPAGGERSRVEGIQDFIFSGLDLRYSLMPTRSAVETFAVREGNCLSYVNLFVGIARHQRLNAFYVEVEDYQRWNYQRGVVISRGHIVAGMYIDGELSTFDFLPYRPKSYRKFRAIDDLAATAHYYNNLGAEALIHGDTEGARRLLALAVGLAPDFEKALNNYGLALLRLGEVERAAATLERGLKLHPASVPLLSNLVRAYQQSGRVGEAEELMARLEEVNETNPYFFIYRGEVALGEGDAARALDYMRRALRADSETPEVHIGLLKVYLALGDLRRARHHLERALKLDATHEEARRYAAMLAGMEGGGRSGGG